METQNIGQAGEDAAAEYLKANGYRIRERNYANTRGLRLGEIDIVAEKQGEIVFVEVKAAFILAGREERLPEWQVTRAKLRKMEKAASVYLKERRLEEREYSFDVVAVTFAPDCEPEIRHLDHVFLS
ncbi:MAG: YraN family protein [Candidatus Moraniibacteriota bacterium]